MINHTVSFKLKHPAGSPAEKEFLDYSVKVLAPIEGVHDFKVLRQIGKKCAFDFCFSMNFDTQADYDTYSACATHRDYVRDIWLKQVSDFLEQDFMLL